MVISSLSIDHYIRIGFVSSALFFWLLLTLHPCVPLYPQRTITLDQCLRTNFLFIHNKNGRTPAIYGKDRDGLLAFFLHLFWDFLIAPPTTPRTRRTRSTGSPAQHLPPSLAILISRPDTWPSSGWNMADLDDFPMKKTAFMDGISQNNNGCIMIWYHNAT